MGLKTEIKNNLWHINYIIPFAKKHQFDEKGKADFAKQILKAYKEIKPVKARRKRTVGNDTAALLESVNLTISKDAYFIYSLDTHKTIAVPGNIVSNFTIDYDKIIHGTFRSLVKPAATVDDEYGREAKRVYAGVKRLRDNTLKAIEDSDLSDEVKQKRIADFSNILEEKALHFEEALQRILFFNQIMWQTRHRLNGLGRLDLILGDLYEKDVKDGILDRKITESLLDEFIKELSKYKDYKSDALEGDIGQIIILGGLNPEGTYFSNELTRLFLEAQARSCKPDPKTILRVSKKTPRELIGVAVRCLEARTGSPLFSNDDVVIPSLLNFGIPECDAYNYCTSACWEPFIVGKSFDQNNMAVFDYFKAFDEVLNSEQGQKCSDIEKLISLYIEKNQENFRKFLTEVDELKWAPDPLVSLFTNNCTEKRVDVSEGGAIYGNYGITTVGLANVVDSFCNLRRLVFEEKRYNIAEINKQRNENFSNNASIYNELRSAVKSYGHDEDEVINLTNKITQSLTEIAKAFKNKLGGTVKFGLSSPAYNMLSKHTAADLAGRKAGMPYSTHISCVDVPYTEIVGFASKLDYTNQRFNGYVVDFFVSPDFIKNNYEKFCLFMKGAIAAGFFQMQMNVMDSKTLIDAKAHPEKYKGLIVRVWGFSAYFNDLPESYKDLLIERAKNAERLEGSAA